MKLRSFYIYIDYIYVTAASFSETFYGLKRISLVDKKFHDQLSTKQKYLSLLFLVLLPYFREKLSKLSYRYKLQEADNYIPKSVSKNIIIIIIINNVIWIIKLYHHYRNGKDF